MLVTIDFGTVAGLALVGLFLALAALGALVRWVGRLRRSWRTRGDQATGDGT